MCQNWKAVMKEAKKRMENEVKQKSFDPFLLPLKVLRATAESDSAGCARQWN